MVRILRLGSLRYDRTAASVVVYPVAETSYTLETACSDSGLQCISRDDVTLSVLAATSPIIEPNSLGAVKLSADIELTWNASGPRRYNVHRTGFKTELPSLYTSLPLNSSELAIERFSAASAPGGLNLFEVYGINDCNDRSVP